MKEHSSSLSTTPSISSSSI